MNQNQHKDKKKSQTFDEHFLCVEKRYFNEINARYLKSFDDFLKK